MSDVMEHGSRFLRDLRSAANRNPLSAALIGVGVLWLFAGRNGVQKARTVLDRASDVAGEAMDLASSAVSSGASAAQRAMNVSAETVQRGTSDTLDTSSRYTSSRSGGERMRELSEYGRSIPESWASQLQGLGDGLTDMFRRQPLALGAIGVAIGAGIAAALPLTEMEAVHLGEAGEAVKEQAGEFVAGQAARAKDLAGRVMDATTEEARRQGLTPEGIKAAADETKAKLGRVIDAAKEGIADAKARH